MKLRAAILIVVIGTSLVGNSAFADDKEAARQAYLEGTRRYDLNEFAPALEAFKRAYLAFEDPAFLYNIAQCHRQLGNKAEAVKFYRSYLRKVPDAPNRDEVSATIANLDTAIAAENAAAREKQAAAAATTRPTPAPSGNHEAIVVESAPPRRKTPVYKKWWLWTIVGVVAAGAATGVALAVTSQKTENAFMPVTVSR